MANRVQPGDVGYIKAFYSGVPYKKYPWEEWSDGNTWKLVRGQDYSCTDATMIDNAKKWGKRRGLAVLRRVHPAGIYLRFVPKEEATT